MKFFNTAIFAVITLLVILLAGCRSGSPADPALRDDAGMSTASATLDATPSGDVFPNILPGKTPGAQEWAADEVLIVLRDSADPAAIYPIAKQKGLQLIREIRAPWDTIYRMRITNSASVPDVVNDLKAYPEVRLAEPNYYVYFTGAPYYPNDPLFEFSGDADDSPWSNMLDQWGPNVLGASLVWAESNGDPSVIVAVLDTGIRFTHEDLKNQIWINEDEIPDNGIDDDNNGYIDDWHGWDFNANDNDPLDTYGHGTPCSGVVAAEQDNGVGCSGIAPGVTVMPLEVNVTFQGLAASVVEAVAYAYENGADIVSMSFRIWEDSQIMHDAFIATWDDGNGLLPIGAAGNEDNTNLTYPANWPEVLMVGATCSFYPDGQRRDVKRLNSGDFGWGSSFGDNLEIMAPGALYITTAVGADNAYHDGVNQPTFAGTSNATPCIAGCAALLKSFHPDWTSAQIRDRLNATSDDIMLPGRDIESGFGQVNIWRAVYGSEPNEGIYDENGHIPMTADDNWNYDNIFDVSTSFDYDFEDIFTVEAPSDGVLAIDVDIITTGEDLDIEIYSDPLLTNLLAPGLGPNNYLDPIENASIGCLTGEKFYLRVFSPNEYNCSSFRIKAVVVERTWWMDWKSLAPVYMPYNTPSVPLLRLDFHTNEKITIERLNTYLSGDIPLGLINHFRLFIDSDSSGDWNSNYDEQVAIVPVNSQGTNQVVFSGLSRYALLDSPLSYILVADCGPLGLDHLVNIGLGLRTYQDVEITEDALLLDDPFPIISDQTFLGPDLDPPVWQTTTGLQKVWAGLDKAGLYWNNAVDNLSEPTTYTVYVDENNPPEIATSSVIENIPHSASLDYDFYAEVPDLELGKTYYFLVRAVDGASNEDDNLVWKSGTTSMQPDPTHPQLIGMLQLYDITKDVFVNNKTAYVAYGGGIAIIDCTDPFHPALVSKFPETLCEAIFYYEPQGLLYAACQNGLVIVNPTAPGGPTLVGSYPGVTGREVFVDSGICYLAYADKLALLDISTPATPQFISEIPVASYQGITGLEVRDGIAYCAAALVGFVIVDCTIPGAPYIAGTANVGNYAYEVDLWGTYAVVSNFWSQQVYIVDVSDIQWPFEVGMLDVGNGWGTGIAVRDASYIYFGSSPSVLATIGWGEPSAPTIEGNTEAFPINGLFFDGQYLYAALSYYGLAIYL